MVVSVANAGWSRPEIFRNIDALWGTNLHLLEQLCERLILSVLGFLEPFHVPVRSDKYSIHNGSTTSGHHRCVANMEHLTYHF